MSVGRFLQQAAAGNAGEAVYVDDVFSTYLYTGTGSAQTITNGIDLDGEGGMVWIKNRDQSAGNAQEHILSDTERGVNKHLSTNNTDAEESATRITAFNTNGFSVSNSTATGYSGWDYASWTFRKQPGFFDVVTYTGDGVAGRTVSHNLGSVPGMIIVKRRDAEGHNLVYHRSVGNTGGLLLNGTSSTQTNSTFWNNTSPTDTEFSVGTYGSCNASGGTYVAYLFAHDAQDFGTGSDESIIKCGSYTGTGSAGNTIDVGFEPQWIMFKRTNSSSDWVIFDSMRGLTTSGNNGDRYLYPNQSTAEGGLEQIGLTATGFVTEGSWGEVNASGGNYIYVAIRRPHKPASEFAATDLFAIDTSGGTSPTPPRYTSGFPVDLVYQRTNVSATNAGAWWTRLTASLLYPSLTDAESTSSAYSEYFAENEGFQDLTSVSSTNYAWMFRRAPGFFDVVAYTGNGFGTHNVSHNLGVKPELVICKSRSIGGTGYNWPAITDASVSSSSTLFLNKNSSNGGGSSSGMFTDTTVNVGSTAGLASLYGSNPVNASSVTYIMYLFATVPGISKVGSYVGNGTADGDGQDIDCGFSSGARFVLIKSTDTTSGGWQLFDSARGIIASNDPLLYLHDNAAQVTNEDPIDPYSGGFRVVRRTSTGNSNTNQNNENYIFLAIA